MKPDVEKQDLTPELTPEYLPLYFGVRISWQMLSLEVLKLTSRGGRCFRLVAATDYPVSARHSELLVMRPHADDLDGLLIFQNLVHQPVSNVDPTGIRSDEIAYKLLEWWRSLKGICFHNLKWRFCFPLQSGIRKLSRIFLRLFGEDDFPAHQPSWSAHALTGIFSPFRMDSRIPGIDSK